MRECPTCGQDISDQLAICPYCAATLTSPAELLTPRSAADRVVRLGAEPTVAEGRLFAPLVLPERPAGFGIRLVATLIDLAALTTAAAALSLFAFFLTKTSGGKGLYGQLTVGFSIAAFIGASFYNGVYLPGTRGGSVGKRLCGIIIVHDDGTFIGPWRMLIREMAKSVSLLPLGLGFFWAIWDPRKQTWHDKLVGSYPRFQ